MRALSRLSLALSIVAALALALPGPVQAQTNHTTNITLASLQNGAGAVASAQVCATPVNQYGNPISFSETGWGLVDQGAQFCGAVTGGAISGGISVPDACHSNLSGSFDYTITIQPLVSGDPVGNPVTLPIVPNVCGPTWALDNYSPAAVASLPPSGTFSAAPGVPSTCANPWLYINTSTSTVYTCSAGVPVALAAPGLTIGKTAGTAAAGNLALTYQGTYSPIATYALNDVVSSGSVLYLSLLAVNNGNTPLISQSAWKAVTGSVGPTGPPITFMGAWSSTVTYSVGEAVSYTDGSSYVSLVASNLNNIPSPSSANWGLLAAAGTLNSSQSAQLASVGVQTVIGAPTPSNGGGYDNGNSYVLGTSPISGTVSSVQIYSLGVASGSLIVATPNAGTYTATATLPVSLLAGLNTISAPSLLTVSAGQVLAFYSPGVAGSPLAFNTSTGTTCYAAGQIATATAQTSCALPGTPQANFTVSSGLFNRIVGDEFLIASNTAAAAQTGTSVLLGPTSLVAGGNAFGGFAYINELPAPISGFVRKASVYTLGSGTITFFTATMSAGAFTLVASTTVNVGGAGLNTFTNFSLPIAAGQYFGIMPSMGIDGQASTVVPTLWFNPAGLPGTGTAGSTFGSTQVPYNYTITTGLFDTVASEFSNSAVSGAGIGLLTNADPTGVSDSTVAFAQASAAHPSPYVPVGAYSLTSIPKHGQGFWGDGSLTVGGVRYPIWRAPNDMSLQLANRSALALQSSTGSPIIFMGDSLLSGSGASVEATSFSALYTAWLNYGFVSGAILPVDDYFGTDSSNQPTSFYGLTLSGATQGSTGPIYSTAILSAGGSISFTGAYAQVDFFYDQSPGAGSVVMAFNGTTFKTVSTAGTANTDLFSGPTATGQTSSGTYTLTASGGPVVITGLVRQNSTPLETGLNPIYTIRASHGGFSVSNFSTQQMASMLKQASGLAGGASPEVIVDLITNDMGLGPSGLATFQAGLARIFAYLQANGASVKYLLPQYPLTNPNFFLYSGAAQAICKQYGVPVFHSDGLNFGENPGLFYSDGLHWSDAGNAKMLEAWARWRASQ